MALKSKVRQETGASGAFMSPNFPLGHCIHQFLDGDTDLREVNRLPAGVISCVKIYVHTTETNHEDVGFRIRVNGAVAIPTAWNAARDWMYLPPAGTVLVLELDWTSDDWEATVETQLSAAPANGVTFDYEYKPIRTTRKSHKAFVKNLQEDLEVNT